MSFACIYKNVNLSVLLPTKFNDFCLAVDKVNPIQASFLRETKVFERFIRCSRSVTIVRQVVFPTMCVYECIDVLKSIKVLSSVSQLRLQPILLPIAPVFIVLSILQRSHKWTKLFYTLEVNGWISALAMKLYSLKTCECSYKIMRYTFEMWSIHI